MQTCDLLIQTELILTQDIQRSLLRDAAIAIDAGRIVAIGKSETMLANWQAREIRNLGHSLVIPGLVNAHTHAAMTFLRGFADDLPLVEWLNTKIFPIEATLTKEIVETGSLLGFAEMLRTGTTACLDMYIFEEAVFRAAERAGIDLTAGEGAFIFPSAACKNYQEALEQTESLANKYKNASRLHVVVSPHAVYTSNPYILRDCLATAEKLDLPLHMHLAESKGETAQCLSQHNLRPIPYVAELGFFNQPLTIAHVVDVTEEERQTLAQAKECTIVHNPGSNMKLASGICEVSTMQKLGLSLALGTDGPASNNQLNMFLEMNRAALLAKVAGMAPDILPAAEVFDMATLGGAKALHRDNTGSLAVGKRADMTALSLTSPNLMPLYDPISQIVYAATGQEVIMTMVEGEILYDHGTFTRFSFPDLCREVEDIRRYIVKTFAKKGS